MTHKIRFSSAALAAALLMALGAAGVAATHQGSTVRAGDINWKATTGDINWNVEAGAANTGVAADDINW
ncbi:hypothetical protein [Actinacidiphila glaucinigra]|uniref:hypothetical protein n=1 Tax=Actinacidiphila glaucinigra TaxID=235986 RepID=UPI003D9184DE